MKQAVLALSFLLVLMANPLCADGGTPLMWAGLFHLFIGNLLIGIGEGLLIALIFKTRIPGTIGIMIAANYFSAWVGSLVFFNFGRLVHPDIYLGYWLIWLAVLASFLLSVLLEWPFVLLAFRRKTNRGRSSLLASLVAQTASYLLLIPFYLSASSLSLYTNATLDRNLLKFVNTQAVLYYLAPDNHTICRLPLSSLQSQKVAFAPFHVRQLQIAKSDLPGAWDICAQQSFSDSPQLVVLKGISGQADPMTGFPHYAADFRPESQRQWQFRAYDLSYQGLICTDPATAAQIQLALDTPFLSWRAGYVSVLPCDQVVFQLGDQICLFDLPSRKLALITRGRCPIVVLENPQAYTFLGVPEDSPGPPGPNGVRLISAVHFTDYQSYLDYKKSGRISSEETHAGCVYFAVKEDHCVPFDRGEFWATFTDRFKAPLPSRP